MYEVYRNLHKDCYSIRDSKTKHVVGHAESVSLSNVTFHVSESGRQRVLREKKKNVHAVVRGDLIWVGGFTPFKDREITMDGFKHHSNIWSIFTVSYNPFKYTSFVRGANARPIFGCEFLDMTDEGLVGENYVEQN